MIYQYLSLTIIYIYINISKIINIKNKAAFILIPHIKVSRNARIQLEVTHALTGHANWKWSTIITVYFFALHFLIFNWQNIINNWDVAMGLWEKSSSSNALVSKKKIGELLFLCETEYPSLSQWNGCCINLYIYLLDMDIRCFMPIYLSCNNTS